LILATSTGTCHIDGPSHLVGFDNNVAKWVARHTVILSWACFNAFELKDHPERGSSHIFLVVLESKPRQKKKKPGRQFHIAGATLLTRDDFVRTYRGVEVLLNRLDEQEAARKSNGVLSNMFVRHDGDWYSQGMVWEQTELETMQKEGDWMSVLKSVTVGEKKYTMRDGNPIRQ